MSKKYKEQFYLKFPQKNIILKDKFNQENERSIHPKLWHWWKKFTMTQINEKLLHFHMLEEFILLKYPYYPNYLYKSHQNFNVIFHWNGN